MALFAAPAMASGTVKAPCCETLNSIDGSMAFVKFPENINFDFVKQGNQEAWTFGFAGSKPVARNAFNLEKEQFSGAIFDTGDETDQGQTTDATVIRSSRTSKNLQSTQVANIEIIQSGNQIAKAFGAGIADNQVNIKTVQSPCKC